MYVCVSPQLHDLTLCTTLSGCFQIVGSRGFAGLTLLVGNILSWRLIMKYFLWSFSHLPIQEGQLSVSGERMCRILVNCLEDLACPVKSVVR